MIIYCAIVGIYPCCVNVLLVLMWHVASTTLLLCVRSLSVTLKEKESETLKRVLSSLVCDVDHMMRHEGSNSN